MRAVFIASREPCYMAASIWRGMNEVLGIGNVLDTPAFSGQWPHYLHDDMGPKTGQLSNRACEAIGRFPGSGFETRWDWTGGKSVPGTIPCENSIHADLVVLNYSSWKDTQSWATASDVLDHIYSGYKLAYVCGDDHTGPYPDPPVPETVRFQREMDHLNGAIQLSFAAPADWACSDVNRPIDAIFCGAVNNIERRNAVDLLCEAAKCRGMSAVIAAGERRIAWRRYMELLRQSKVAICPPGAAGCRDTMRHHEAEASGCTVLTSKATMADLVNAVESYDPAANVDRFLKHGTTAERARQLLKACGFTV